MRKQFSANVAGWFLGALALAVFAAVVVPRGHDQGTAQKHIDPSHVRSNGPTTTATLPAPTDEAAIEHALSPENRLGATQNLLAALTTPESLFAALYSIDPEQRLTALDAIGQSLDQFYTQENILRRIDELTADADLRIAELASLMSVQMTALRGMQDILMNTNQDAYIAVNSQPQIEASGHAEPHRTIFTADASNGPGTETEYFAQLSARAFHNSDAAIRLQAIIEAQTQRDERAITLLSQATHDSEPENRLVAVEGLRQMLVENFGDPGQISSVLLESSNDPNPKVARAAQTNTLN